jgi:hypothetical protein
MRPLIRARRALLPALVVLLLLTVPVSAQEAPLDPAAQAAEQARRQAAEAAAQPLTLADFAGAWVNHNAMLRISPDGTAEMTWRRGGAGVEPGRATLSIERVDGRTLYGTVLTTSHADGIARGPFTLTEQEHGVGELMDARSPSLVATASPDPGVHGLILCGPRFAQAPAWVVRLAPCGA